MTRTKDQLALPRESRVLIPQRYERLETAASVEDFKIIFIDVVRGAYVCLSARGCVSTGLPAHHWLWSKSPILHGDISTINIMWYRIGDKVIGVLCDGDLAKQMEAGGGIAPTRADETFAIPTTNLRQALRAEVPRRGLAQRLAVPKPAQSNRHPGLFMAMDLLCDGPAPIHHYRHDLESFVYVLVYLCAVWDPSLKKFGHLSAWEHDSFFTLRNAKASMFKNGHIYNQIFANAHSSLKALTVCAPKPALVPRLAAMFCAVDQCNETVASLRSSAGLSGKRVNEAQIRI